MTIREVIEEYRGLRRPGMDNDTLLRVINNTEARIKREIIDRSADSDEYPFAGYSAADLGAELLAPPPYDTVYVWECCYQTDLRENQQANAANSYSMTEDIFRKLGDAWIAGHRPKAAKNISDGLHNI